MRIAIHVYPRGLQYKERTDGDGVDRLASIECPHCGRIHQHYLRNKLDHPGGDDSLDGNLGERQPLCRLDGLEAPQYAVIGPKEQPAVLTALLDACTARIQAGEPALDELTLAALRDPAGARAAAAKAVRGW